MGGSKKCDVTREKINIFYFILLNADTKNKHELNQVQHGFDMLFFKVKAMIPRFPSRWLGNCSETTKVAETISSVLVYCRRRFDAIHGTSADSLVTRYKIRVILHIKL